MKSSYFKKLPLLVLLFLAFVLTVSAQTERKRATRYNPRTAKVKKTTKQVRISQTDKNAILSLFRGVDQRRYKLQFYNGQRKRAAKYGRLRYSMNDLNRVKRVTNPIDAVGWIVFVVEGDDVIYVLAVGSDKLKSVLGVQKVKRLNAIMAKYK